ncbi:glycosyltransferase family 4 protein [Polaribacter sp. Asnod1-A03]|uniref:glycosyltransferase family 4 protein n=1 Tax=Polaribacter sp. Asnod1-A03 TaxID=3160581 RepID=UPI0038694086
MDGVFSIEMVFEQLFQLLPKEVEKQEYVCTPEWKRYRSFLKARKFQGSINHITGDIHTIALFLKGNKTILTVHDIGRYERNLTGIRKLIIKYLWLQWPLKKVAYVTTISEFTKQKLIDTCQIEAKKIKVIPNPASTDFKPNKKDFNEEQPLVLQIGGSSVKNLPRLIKAVQGTPFRLLLLRKPTAELKRQLDEANITYEFRYNLTRGEVYQCYCDCDLVFFASEHEGFGVPILEAQQVGRPVITSNILPMNDVAGEGALLVNPTSIDEIKKALQKLKTKTEFRKNLLEKGNANLKRFSVTTVADKYVNLYKQLTKDLDNI